MKNWGLVAGVGVAITFGVVLLLPSRKQTRAEEFRTRLSKEFREVPAVELKLLDQLTTYDWFVGETGKLYMFAPMPQAELAVFDSRSNEFVWMITIQVGRPSLKSPTIVVAPIFDEGYKNHMLVNRIALSRKKNTTANRQMIDSYAGGYSPNPKGLSNAYSKIPFETRKTIEGQILVNAKLHKELGSPIGVFVFDNRAFAVKDRVQLGSLTQTYGDVRDAL